MYETYKTDRNKIRTHIFHGGELYERSVLLSGPHVERAFQTESMEMRPSFIGVTKIHGEWWSVHHICNEMQTVDTITW
jgi:hypothetical protein